MTGDVIMTHLAIKKIPYKSNITLTDETKQCPKHCSPDRTYEQNTHTQMAYFLTDLALKIPEGGTLVPPRPPPCFNYIIILITTNDLLLILVDICHYHRDHIVFF